MRHRDADAGGRSDIDRIIAGIVMVDNLKLGMPQRRDGGRFAAGQPSPMPGFFRGLKTRPSGPASRAGK